MRNEKIPVLPQGLVDGNKKQFSHSPQKKKKKREGRSKIGRKGIKKEIRTNDPGTDEENTLAGQRGQHGKPVGGSKA